jgi:hypothetical protein
MRAVSVIFAVLAIAFVTARAARVEANVAHDEYVCCTALYSLLMVPAHRPVGTNSDDSSSKDDSATYKVEGTLRGVPRKRARLQNLLTVRAQATLPLLRESC